MQEEPHETSSPALAESASRFLSFSSSLDSVKLRSEPENFNWIIPPYHAGFAEKFWRYLRYTASLKKG